MKASEGCCYDAIAILDATLHPFLLQMHAASANMVLCPCWLIVIDVQHILLCLPHQTLVSCSTAAVLQ